MPKLPAGSDKKVLTIAPKTRGFGVRLSPALCRLQSDAQLTQVNVKSMDAAGLEKMRKDAMRKAQEELEKAEREAESCKPSWLLRLEKTQD